MKPHISVFGLGYVGIPFSIFLAERGLKVYAVDVDRTKISLLTKGISPIYEADLNNALKSVLDHKLIEFTGDPIYAVNNSNISFITVGTPTEEDGTQDLSSLISVMKTIGHVLKNDDKYHIVVVKSTILPETSRKILIPILESKSKKQVGKDFGYVYNPEFIREGKALKDFRNPSRVVLGGSDQYSVEILENLYKKIYRDNVPIITTTIENAEMIKYANNAYLAMKISFINTIARICELTPNADIDTVSKVIGLDPRISPSYMEAGLGFGGSCLPKDLRALIKYAQERGYDPQFLKVIIGVNSQQALWAVEKLENIFGNLKNKIISILGLTFKEDTDDVRESQSIPLINVLLSRKTKVKVYDPMGMKNFRHTYYYLSVEYASDPIDCIKDSDAVIIATKWSEFKKLKPEDFRKYMKRPIILDGRGLYDPKEFESKDIHYIRIGSFYSIIDVKM